MSDLISDIAVKIHEGKVTLLLGPDLPWSGPNYPPNWAGIAGKLASECGCGCLNSPIYSNSLPRLCGHLESRWGRPQLGDVLRNACLTPDLEVPELYKLVASIPFRAVFTSAFDRTLERAYSASNIRCFSDQVHDDSWLQSASPNSTRIIHLTGVDGPDLNNWIITDKDMHQLLHANEVSGRYLRQALTDQYWILIGWHFGHETFFDYLHEHLLVDVKLAYSRCIIWSNPDKIIDDYRKGQGYSIHPHEYMDFLRHLGSKVREEPAYLPPAQTRECKYLSPYTEKDRDLFFGRDQERDALIRKIMNARRLSVIVGASGVGKTSLILAGIIPYLRQNYSTKAIAVYVDCLVDPIAAVQSGIIQELQERRNSKARNQLTKEEWHNLHEHTDFPLFMHKVAVLLSSIDPDIVLYLFLDQFEAFDSQTEFLQGVSFLRTLWNLIRHVRNLHLIFCLREDRYFSFLDLRRHLPQIDEIEAYTLYGLPNTVVVAVIKRTVTALGYDLERELPEKIVHELSDDRFIDPSALQIVLYHLLDGCDPSHTRLTVALYDQLGGAEGILGGFLTRALVTLQPKGLAIAKAILLALIAHNGTSRPRSIEEIVKAAQDVTPEAEESDIKDILNFLITKRLVRNRRKVNPRPGDERNIYEITHEHIARSSEVQHWHEQKDAELEELSEIIRQGTQGSLRDYFSLDSDKRAKVWRIIESKEESLRLLPKEWKWLASVYLKAGEMDPSKLNVFARQMPSSELRQAFIERGELSVEPILATLAAHENLSFSAGRDLLDALLQIKSKQLGQVEGGGELEADYTIISREVIAGRYQMSAPEDLDPTQQWVYRTVSSLNRNRERDRYVALLRENSIEGRTSEERRCCVIRLLGALGVESHTLVSLLSDQLPGIQRYAARALQEMGEVGGLALLKALMTSEDSDTVAKIFQVLRKIMDNPTVSIEFIALCYCAAFECIIQNSKSPVWAFSAISAAPIIGYFEYPGDLENLENKGDNDQLKRRLAIAIAASPRQSSDVELQPLYLEQHIISLAKHFDLQDSGIANELIADFARADWLPTWNELYSLFPTIGSQHRPIRGQIGSGVIGKLLERIRGQRIARDRGDIEPDPNQYHELLLAVSVTKDY